jgi:enoyl-[acyl-carrier-protein] reductase (NADH)
MIELAVAANAEAAVAACLLAFGRIDILINNNCISPGATETAYMTAPLANQPAMPDAMLGHIPLGRFSKPAEVAEAIVFLATCEGDAIQGHDLLVDGGRLHTDRTRGT